MHRARPRRKGRLTKETHLPNMTQRAPLPLPSSLLIGDLFRRNAELVPHRVAAWMAGEQLTYRELNDHGNRLARDLYELGVRRGDRVVSWADTSLGILPVVVALAKLGAVFAPLNPKLGIEEATPIIRLARPSMLIADFSLTHAAAVVKEKEGIPFLGSIGNSSCTSCDIQLDFNANHDRCEEFVDLNIIETDPHVIFFTSGSTGLPKGVILSHRANYLRSFQGVFLDVPERSVCMFPLFHMAAYTLAFAAWQTRGEIAFVESATASLILEAVQERHANRLYCIPAVWNRILATAPAQWETSSLRFIDTGTSATPIELLRQLAERFPNASLRVYYGSTEVGAGTALLGADVLTRAGSVGLPCPGVDLKFTDAGEICLRSAYLTDGYFDAPEVTAEALRDGWFHTGDLGALDEERNLSVIGRLKEIIRTGGESVVPTEVEAVISKCPTVEEVAVVGIPDSQWGEIVCAVVVPKHGCTVALSQLQELCECSLASFKKPRRLELVDSFPRTTSTGQIQRALLVAQMVSGGSNCS
jgi:fatty-acyl-CoA synthase